MCIAKYFVAALVGCLLGEAALRAADVEKPQPHPAAKTLIVVDNAGKEHKLKTWKFVAGTQHLAWLAPSKKPARAKGDQPHEKPVKDCQAEPTASVGPEVLVLREDNSTELQDGILTYVFLDRIRSIEFNNEKRKITVRVIQAPDKGENDKGAEEILTGSTAYAGDNKVGIEAEADLGDLGVATVKFQGGGAKGIKEIRFPTPKVPAADKGRPAEVTAADKAKSIHKILDLEPLYQLRGGLQRLPTLLFKKTVKIGLEKIKKLTFVEGGDPMEYEVALKDGKAHTLILLDRTSPLDGKAGQLLGLVGKVPAGYKLFPVKPAPNNVFTSVAIDGEKGDAKEDPKKEKKDKSDKDKDQ